MAKRQPTRSAVPVLRITLPLLAAASLAVVLLPLFPTSEATAWGIHPTALAGSAWAGQLWYVGRILATTAGASPAWGQLVGMANALTLVRGGLYAVVAGFVVVSPDTTLLWVPALCYGAGVTLDGLDGAVARTVGRQTTVGRRLDVAFDTFGFVVAPLVAVLWGQLPVWYLSLSAARYVYLGGLHWRRRRDRPVFDRPDSDLGKYLAAIQMAFLTAALVPIVPTTLVWRLAPFVLAPSLGVFVRDFLVASGRLSTATAGRVSISSLR
jgi:CDP-diacylglycerol--glycerol-3-phosphate 3-phosphatidyltransferase